MARVDDAHLVDLVALPKLVYFAEHREFSTDVVCSYLKEEFSGYELDKYGELVLGCTHFNYFKDSFRKIMPDNVQIIDGSQGTVNQLKRILEKRNQLEENAGEVRYFASGREVTADQELQHIKELHDRLEDMCRII